MIRRKEKFETSIWKVGDTDDFSGISFDDDNVIEPCMSGSNEPETEGPCDE